MRSDRRSAANEDDDDWGFWSGSRARSRQEQFVVLIGTSLGNARKSPMGFEICRPCLPFVEIGGSCLASCPVLDGLSRPVGSYIYHEKTLPSVTLSRSSIAMLEKRKQLKRSKICPHPHHSALALPPREQG